MAWVYILRCADGSYYVGSTLDMERRLWQHNEGIGAAYTKWRRPVAVAWAAEYHNVADAFALEKKIQNWSRAKREALIEGRFDDLPLLSRGRTGWMKRGEGGGLD